MHRGLVITLAASTKRATERAPSSRIVEKAETGLRGKTWAAAGGIGEIAPTASRLMTALHLERLVIEEFIIEEFIIEEFIIEEFIIEEFIIEEFIIKEFIINELPQ
jgi:hypothetical protein